MGNPILDNILNKYGGGDNGSDNSSSPTDAQSGNPILDNILKEFSQPHISPAPNLSMQGLREINNNIPDYKPPLIDTIKNTVLGLPNYTQPTQSSDGLGQSTITQYNPNIFEKIGSFLSDVKSGILPGVGESVLGKLATGLGDQVMQKSYENAQQQGKLVGGIPTVDNTPFVPQNTAQGIGQFIGSNIADAPLWMAGEGLTGKLLAPIAESAPIVNLASKLPGPLSPIVGGGIKDALTYGVPINLADTIASGDGTQGFIQREKQLPMVAAGGMALRGIGAGISKGLGLNNIPNQEANNVSLQLPKLENNPLQPLLDVQNAYQTPSLRDVKAQDYQNLFKNVEAPSTQNNMLRAENPSQYFGNTTQADVEAAFPPLKVGQYSFTTGEQRAMGELSQGMQTAQNYVGHNDVLAAYPPGTSIDQAYADIKANTGVDIPKLTENLVQAQNAKTTLTPEELRMGKVAGVIPDLKPRVTPEPTVVPTIEQPTQSNIFERRTWTNKDNIPSVGSAPIKSITPENVGQLPGGIKSGPGFGKASEADVTMEPKLQVAAAKIEKPSATNEPSSYILKQGENTAPKLLPGGTATGEPNQFIYDRPMDFTGDNRPTDNTGIAGYLKNKTNLSANTQDILHQYVSNRDTNKLRANVLATDVRKNLTTLEDTANTVAVQNTPEELQAYVNNPSPNLDKPYTENGSNIDKTTGKPFNFTYRDIYKQALNQSDNAKGWADKVNTYQNELGAYSQKTGSVQDLKSHYMTQAWNPPDISLFNKDELAQNKIDAQSGKVGTEAHPIIPENGVNQNTGHAKHTTYQDYGQGIVAGETPKSMRSSDLVQKIGNDMAPVNANREFASAFTKDGVGVVNDRIPAGYEKVATIGDQILSLPKEYAKAFAPILEPDFITKSKIAGNLSDFQNYLKTSKLGLSLFHYKNEIVSALGNGDYKSLATTVGNATHVFKAMEDPAWRKIRDDMIQSGQGMSSMLQKNMDTNMRLSGSSSALGKQIDKLHQLPVGKQVKGAIEANNKYMFDGVIEFNKVNAYGNKVATWMGQHPSATPQEVFKAKGSIAREVNGTYGGLNWDSLGVNKTFLKFMRIVQLAPDWTYSNIDLAGQALTKKLGDPGGDAAKKFWIRNAVIATAILEGGSFAATGHGTWQNPKGHEFDTEISPGVWVTPYGGAMGDLTKVIGNVVQHGTQGIPQFLQGKLSPLLSTGIGIMTGRDYYGRQFAGPKDDALSTTKKALAYAAGQLSPLPFAASPVASYLKGGNVSPLGVGLTATGLGKYSADKPQSSYANPASAYTGNWLNNLLNPADKASNDLINKISAQNKSQTDNSKLINEGLGKALSTGGSTANIFEQYNVPANKQAQLLKAAKDNLANSQLSPLAQKFNGMSKDGQKQFLSTLSPAERATLGNVKLKKK